jgi:hypothetical protein
MKNLIKLKVRIKKDYKGWTKENTLIIKKIKFS